MKKLALFMLIAILAAYTSAVAGVLFDSKQPTSETYNAVHQKSVVIATTLVITDDQITCTPTSVATGVITLPPITSTAGIAGKVYRIVNNNTAGWPVTVTASTSDTVTNTIEGVASRLLYGYGSEMIIDLQTGTDWKVSYETNPYSANMYAGYESLALPLQSFPYVASSPTTSTTMASSYCGQTILMNTDALTHVLPSGPVGCKITFINAGANAYIIAVKTNGTAKFQGTCFSGAASGVASVISSLSGSTLTNTKATSQIGDKVELISASTSTWLITNCTGTWASN